ncbi:MAG TPA: hypothetical protein VFF69_05215 [Phycisphaerales bacterium]|nr:hypothetical protein [Phycisphaerales bacterium]
MRSGAMSVQFIKRAGKPALLRCVRADGSATMAEIAPGPAHDLIHFAVETTLACRRGFYSLLAEGWSIEGFNVAGAAQKLAIPEEAIAVEFIVGLLQMELLSGVPAADFRAELERALAGAKSTAQPPPMTAGQLATIRERIAELLGRWRALPPGSTMVLSFESST